MMLYYEDQCFAYGGPGNCLVLTQMDCCMCPFYKTEEELEEERARSEQRLCRLTREDSTNDHKERT